MNEFPALGNVNVPANSVAFIAGYGIRLRNPEPAQQRAIYGIDAARNFMTNHAVKLVFAPKEQDVANELRPHRLRHRETHSRSEPKGLAMRSTCIAAGNGAAVSTSAAAAVSPCSAVGVRVWGAPRTAPHPLSLFSKTYRCGLTVWFEVGWP
ncbi:type IV secretory system conjugative DNA transfer family protein [Bradyrhizobium japonicum]|uniref:type IV secretory system conjugative DNA transfer family protein n=1 Tax=Bradyrhizobium japonicum TaxID=375 RepID=UPI003B66E16A